MVGIAVEDTRGLPAQEASPRIRSVAVDPIEVDPPARTRSHAGARHRRQGNSRGRVPDPGCFIDPGSSLPSRIPRSAVASRVKVDRQVNPFSCRRNLILAILPDVRPVVAQKDLYHVAVPEFVSIATVRSRRETI